MVRTYLQRILHQLTRPGGTFLLWGLFDAVSALGSWLFLRETRGLSLEQMASDSFGKDSGQVRYIDEVEDVHQEPKPV